MNNNIYILDTNVILTDPDCLEAFSSNHVVVPFVVLEELDQFKNQSDSLGFAARKFGRQVDKICEKHDNSGPHSSIDDGMSLQGGGSLTLLEPFSMASSDEDDYDFLGDESDNELLKQVIEFSLHESDVDHEDITLVTQDILLRLKADSLGINVENFRNNMSDRNVFEGIQEEYVSKKAINQMYNIDGDSAVKIGENRYYSNQIVNFIYGSSQSVLARIDDSHGERTLKLIDPDISFMGIHPRNREQTAALHLLNQEDIELVCLSGNAGTGKTICTLAAGLFQLGIGPGTGSSSFNLSDQEESFSVYDRMIISKPTVSMGEDIGFLPGSAREKMDQWLYPFYDNFDQIFNDSKGRDVFKDLEGRDKIDVQPLAHVRGRSLANAFIVIDEAQNLSNLEIKTIVSRVGENSKIVLMGDPEQIDNAYLSKYGNGLSYTIDTFRDHSIAGHAHLKKGERSELAELAAQQL